MNSWSWTHGHELMVRYVPFSDQNNYFSYTAQLKENVFQINSKLLKFIAIHTVN